MGWNRKRGRLLHGDGYCILKKDAVSEDAYGIWAFGMCELGDAINRVYTGYFL